jgi:phage baseplate assembly protein W
VSVPYNPALIDTPHFAFPFRMSRNAAGEIVGPVQCVQQDDDDEIMACEQMIAWTPLGSRTERPEFGWPWPMFGTIPVDPSPLVQALQTFEPRGPILSAVEAADTIGAQARDITVQIGVPAS